MTSKSDLIQKARVKRAFWLPTIRQLYIITATKPYLYCPSRTLQFPGETPLTQKQSYDTIIQVEKKNYQINIEAYGLENTHQYGGRF